MKRALDDDIEDYFAMQERKTAKAGPRTVSPPRPPAPEPPPPARENLDITVEESPGQDGLDTIVERVRRFWDR